MIKKEYEKLLKNVQKPARYTGGEYGEVIKNKSETEVRFVFAFPDMYEIGMSNLGIKILSGIINNLNYAWCERVFAPAKDFAEELIKHNLDLYALESGDSLCEFDFIGFTLQYELCYTNILYMLSLSNIPTLASDRQGKDYPLIIGGGPCAYNPEPIADFFDLFVVGEGEEALVEIIELYRGYKKRGLKKNDFLVDCAKKIEGVYVPFLYDTDYKNDGKINSFTAKIPDVPLKIKKRIVKNLDSAYFPVWPLVPNIECVHDRITLEVFRGCIRGCRFCQAGFIYRPLRERSAGILNDLAIENYKNTGYNEISLSSLSISDYSGLYELTGCLKSWTDELNINISLPSMRVDNFTRELLEQTSSVRQSGLTFAPEAGSQRMRDVINKNLSEKEILDTIKTAFDSGRSSIKLYFMIGLPGETDEDITAIAELAKTAVGLYSKRENKQNNRGVTITISTASFVPKCHTPFSFEAQNSYEELIRKQNLLKEQINSKKIKYNYHDAKISKIEAVFARGDRKLSGVLLEAARLGACFDGWDEHFYYDLWLEAFKNCGINIEDYAGREYDYADFMPWDFIDSGVSREYLVSENKKSKLGAATANCREECANCGVLDCNISNGNPQMVDNIKSTQKTENPEETENIKTLRIKFKKAGISKYISHLDLNRIFMRSISRAGIKPVHSKGFNPHPKITFVSALPLGVESFCEFADIKIHGDISVKEAFDKLNIAFPSGINILEVYETEKAGQNFKDIESTKFYIYLKTDGLNADDLKKYFAKDIFIEKKPGITVNLQDYICKFNIAADFEYREYIKIDCILKTSRETYLNPENIIKAVNTEFPDKINDYFIQKTEMYVKDFEIFK